MDCWWYPCCWSSILSWEDIIGLRSDYLAIATLGISEIVIYVFKNEDWLTRGVKNVNGLPRPVPYEIELQSSDWFIKYVIFGALML